VDLVMRVVEESPGMRTGELIQELLDRTGASERTVYSAISRAERQKKLCRVPKGRAVLIYPFPYVSDLLESVPQPGSELVASLLEPAGDSPQPAPGPDDESLQPAMEIPKETSE
jgi:hypothetical protein